MKRLAVEELPGIVVVEPKVFGDSRGFFLETYQKPRYEELGITADFVQQNLSRSCRGTLRGLHYQLEQPQGKMCYVIRGKVFDVFVDLRKNSSTFGCWGSVILDEEVRRQVYIPAGYAHGFCVLSEEADFIYHCTDYYAPDSQYTIQWDDPELGIEWPLEDPILSEKDKQGTPFSEACYYEN